MKQASLLIKELQGNQYIDKFNDIYVDIEVANTQKQRYVEALQEFITLYGDQEIAIFSAPGRSEVSGNHTDHQHGQVLAAAVNLDIIGIVSKSTTIKIKSDEYEIEEVDITDLQFNEQEKGKSISLVRGVVARIKELDYKIGGFNGYFTSNVLIGSGLSSSAAFEVLIGTIISGLYNNMEIDSVVIGQVGQYAENQYFGKPCGLMDQCASAVGSLIYIDFNDPILPIVKKVDIDFSQFEHSLCIVDTQGSHSNLTNEYAAIPEEMRSVAQVFGKDYLRDVDEKRFYQEIATIKEVCNDRAILRAFHFFTENNRVPKAVDALNKGDFDTFKDIIVASGNSSFKYLQNVYTNNDVYNQGVSVALAMSESILQKHGVCRVHGGGFAGTIQVFVEDQYVKTYKEEIEKILGKGTCHILKIRKYGGIRVI
ncbi:MAG: galactokinase [Coprobacillaceae bacterium]